MGLRIHILLLDKHTGTDPVGQREKNNTRKHETLIINTRPLNTVGQTKRRALVFEDQLEVG